MKHNVEFVGGLFDGDVTRSNDPPTEWLVKHRDPIDCDTVRNGQRYFSLYRLTTGTHGRRWHYVHQGYVWR